jgi:hypothetical protein
LLIRDFIDVFHNFLRDGLFYPVKTCIGHVNGGLPLA